MAVKDERKPDLSAIYTKPTQLDYPMPLVDVAVMLIRPESKDPVMLMDDVVDSIEWGDSGEVLYGTAAGAMDGTLTLNRPDAEDPGSLLIGRGHTIRVMVFWAGAWRSIDPDFRVVDPDHDVVGASASTALAGTGGEIFRTSRDWSIRKTKRYPNGRFPGDAVVQWAKELGIPVGQVSRGRYRVASFVRHNMAFGNMLAELYRRERERTGTEYIIGMREGKLYVTPFQRNPTAYVVGDQLTAFTWNRTGQLNAQPTTQIVGKARIGTGKAARTIKMTVTAQEAAKRFGLTQDDVTYHGVKDRTDLRERIHRSLIGRLRVKPSVSITTPLLPFIKRGDAIQLDYPEEGFKGDGSFLFVQSARHRVSGTDASTDLTLSSDDFFAAYQKNREKVLRAEARKKRSRS